MSDGSLLELIIRAGRAIDTAAMADDEQMAADESHGTPEAAASVHWNASSLCRTVGERFIALADGHALQAKRMERAQREERQTGVEYRRGDAA